MTTELPNLKQLPWIEQRACYKEIGNQSPAFRSLRRHTNFLRILISGLLISVCYLLREQMGLMWLIGPVTLGVISDWWIERFFILPFAILHLEKTAEQDGSGNGG
jgi:hypothetical protein